MEREAFMEFTAKDGNLLLHPRREVAAERVRRFGIEERPAKWEAFPSAPVKKLTVTRPGTEKSIGLSNKRARAGSPRAREP